MTNNPPTGTTPDPTVATPDPNTIKTYNDELVRATKTAERYGYVVTQNSAFMQAQDAQVNQSRNILSLFSGQITKTTDAFQGMTDGVSDWMKQLQTSTDLTSAGLSKFGLAVTGALGATESFSKAGANFDHLNLLRGQLDTLIAPIANNKSALGTLADKLGISLPAAIKNGAAPVMASFIRDMATSADNAIKLEDVYVRSAAATGRLGSVHEMAGEQLQKMNQMVRDQRAAINQTMIATNLSKDSVEAYYTQLQKLPLVYGANASAEERARGATGDLTKIVQLARGTGRDFTDVMDDMRTAIRDYNASLPEAEKFTAQISEVSKNWNIELKDVQASLRGTADAFKMFGNEGEGAAAILNEYVGQLKATGLSGAVATDIVGNMTKQIGQLSIAQKAFLSAQQGGPGGLMGAYDIDLKLRQGKLNEVFEMAKNQLTKMTGPLVSLKEAAASPTAAAQYTRQIQMLRQGPLGQFARTDAEAERIIDALKGGRTAEFKELASGQGAVEDATKLGNQYAEQTATGVSRMVSLMEAARGEASGANLNTIQAGFTAAAGTELGDQDLAAVQARKSALSGAMAEGARRVGAPANAGDLIRDFQKAMGDLPVEVKSAIEGVGSILGPEGRRQQEMSKEEFDRNMAAQKEQARSTLTGAQRTAELARLAKEEKAGNTAFSAIEQAGGIPKELTLPSFLKPGQTTALGTPFVTPGNELGTVAANNAARGANATTAAGTAPGGAPGILHAPVPAPAGSLGTITVHVEGYCIECKQKIEGQDTTHSVAVGPKVLI